MIVIYLEWQIGRIMFNAIGQFVFHQQAISQLLGHEEGRGVVGFWFDVGHVSGRSVCVPRERRDGV
jgi:hypothetical protein